MRSRDWGSTPTVGSSSRRTRGSCRMPQARLSRRRMPPENVETGSPARPSRPMTSSARPTAAAAAPPARPCMRAKNRRFSVAVRVGYTAVCCGTRPSTRRAAQVPGHDVRILDLVMQPRGVRHRVLEEVAAFAPDLVGYSAMSFQYATARALAAAVRQVAPGTLHVLGGYHATVVADEVGARDAELFDFVVRGEGEVAFRQLVDGLAGSTLDLGAIPSLSWRSRSGYRHNPDGPLLELDSVPLPRREARAWDGAFYFDRTFDVAETSRGCPLPCTFCSIRRMYGRTFRRFPIGRVIADLRTLDRRGVRGVFFVDDNITIDVPRFKELCEEIQSAGLGHLRYIVQASVHGIAKDPTLAPAMARAGFDKIGRAHV